MKMILSFILGMSFTAGVVYAGQAQAGGMLVGGVVMGVAVTVVVVWKMRERVFPVRETHRIHRVVERPQPTKSEASAKWAEQNVVPVVNIPMRKRSPSPMNVRYYKGLSDVQVDVASALVNFGMTVKEADGVVRVVDGHKGMGFEELMRKCLERTGVGR